MLALSAAAAAAAEEIVVAHFGDSNTITGYLPKEQRIDAVLNALLRKAYPKQKVRNVNLGQGGDWGGERVKCERVGLWRAKDKTRKLSSLLPSYSLTHQLRLRRLRRL